MPETGTEITAEQAEAQFAAALAAPESAAPAAPVVNKVEPDATPTGVTAPVDGTPPKPISSDTPAAPAPKPGEPAAKPQETTDKKSDFAKAKERRDDSWRALKAEQEAHRAEVAKIAAERTAIQQERHRWEQQKARSTSKTTPEQAEQWATSQLTEVARIGREVDGLNAQAQKLEDDGNYEGAIARRAEAKTLERKAVLMEGKADEAKALAKHLRENPPATDAKMTAKLDAAEKHYSIAAADKFPGIFNPGSESLKQVNESLAILKKEGLDYKENPLLIYRVAEFVAAQTAAARVPDLEKRLGASEARVKELEAAVSPGGGSDARPANVVEADFSKMTPDQMAEHLTAQENARR